MPLRYRVVSYFLLFSMIMLVLLWFFQTVFLSGFYKSIKISQVESSAKSLIESYQDKSQYGNTAGILALAEYISKQNDMLVAVYEVNGSVLTTVYLSDSPMNFEEINGSDAIRYKNEAMANGGTYLEFSKAFSDSLSYKDKYDLDKSDLDRYMTENLTYSEVFTDSANNKYVLILRSIITPLYSVVETLRIQLIIISAILVVLSIVLSIIVSNLIIKPIMITNKAAKELAKQNYDVKFDSGGYLEIRELNDTLNFAARELTKVEKLRQDLIANISHDLRTPLTMITGYGEVMRDIPGENTPENIQIIIDEATRLNELVTDLLDISKLQSGAMQLVCTDFSLTKCIEEIFHRYTKLVEQDNYKIVFNFKEDVIINADEVKIKQVLYNLINNAINYVGEDKTVIVSQFADKNSVRIEVTDHGQGIEPDKLEYIWDRYYKVDKAHKSSVIGTGLGLSIVKNILELHNARFGVRSKLGSGSTFWFEIPVLQIKNRHYMTIKKDPLELAEEETINAEVVDFSKESTKKKESSKRRRKAQQMSKNNPAEDGTYEYEVSGNQRTAADTKPDSSTVQSSNDSSPIVTEQEEDNK